MLDERTKLAFEFAQQIAIQLITVSTAFLALTITFVKELVQEQPGGRRWLYWSWGLQLGSIGFGIAALMALTGSLMPLVQSPDNAVFTVQLRSAAGLQVVLFFAGLGSLVAYGRQALKGSKAETKSVRK